MRSRHSSRHSSAFKTSSAIARLQALADAKAARERTQFTWLIAEKELDHRTREAETHKKQATGNGAALNRQPLIPSTPLKVITGAN